MNNRQKQKEDSKKAIRYLKAKFKEKFGYIFIAAFYFIRNNLKYHKKKLVIFMIAISVIMLIFASINTINAKNTQEKINNYSKINSSYEKQITSKRNIIKEQNSEIDKFNISASPKIVRSSEILSQVFNGMYQYSDGKEYQKNRKKNLKYFNDPRSDDVKKIYNEDTDTAGDSIIDNLNLKSSLLEYNIYTDKINAGDSNKLNIKAIVKYQADILGVSSDYASRTHNAIYNIEFDTQKDKITNIEKVKTLNEDKSVE